MTTFRLALHTWTLDTTSLSDILRIVRTSGWDAIELRRVDFARAAAAGRTADAVLGEVKASGLPVACVGVELGWMTATGDERRRLLSVFDELRTIELGDAQVVMQFDNTGDKTTRVVHMTAAHPADLKPSLDGHSIGRWEGETLVIDTIGFEADSSGLGLNVPAGPRKHLVERLTLTDDRTRLRYEVSVEDPDFLTGPATFTQQWDHRPDLEFAQSTGACDLEVARRYKDHVPAQ